MKDNMISIKGLSVDYAVSRTESVHALKSVDLSVKKGESLAVVGESGCGKSTLAGAVLGLLPGNAAVKGSVMACGFDILSGDAASLRKVRGRGAGMIFQEPGASLNPVMQVKEQMQETIIAHEPGIDRKVLDEKCLNLLRETGIKDAQRVYESYPHQLSGGLHQRVMIAIALSCNPEMLIADEPTTALDVTVQAQIVRLLKRLIKDRGLTLVLITHDLHLALELAHRVVVMYAGEIVEDAQISGVKDASHPYTRALFEIIPDMQSRKSDFCVIPGSLPDMRVFMDRCYFSDRCGRVREKCLHKHPDMGKGVRCYFPYK